MPRCSLRGALPTPPPPDCCQHPAPSPPAHWGTPCPPSPTAVSSPHSPSSTWPSLAYSSARSSPWSAPSTPPIPYSIRPPSHSPCTAQQPHPKHSSPQ